MRRVRSLNEKKRTILRVVYSLHSWSMLYITRLS